MTTSEDSGIFTADTTMRLGTSIIVGVKALKPIYATVCHRSRSQGLKRASAAALQPTSSCRAPYAPYLPYASSSLSGVGFCSIALPVA
eukprot:scaffold1757_cov266-Pinguiococcus_pyrenoidosus.AAC.8